MTPANRQEALFQKTGWTLEDVTSSFGD